jgi:hypothetical protein
MKVEKLAHSRVPYQPAVRGAAVGRVWIKVAADKRRAGADEADALVRVR